MHGEERTGKGENDDSPAPLRRSLQKIEVFHFTVFYFFIFIHKLYHFTLYSYIFVVVDGLSKHKTTTPA